MPAEFSRVFILGILSRQRSISVISGQAFQYRGTYLRGSERTERANPGRNGLPTQECEPGRR